MTYEPQFTISPRLLGLAESITALRERIRRATIELAWMPALQKDARARNVHASTAIEGNPLTLEQVRAIEEGHPLAASDERSQREVLNYFAGLRYISKNASRKTIRHEDLFELHRILAQGVMDQGEAGRYRTIAVRVGRHLPPKPQEVSGLMFELLEWWNKRSIELSPILSSAIVHYRFEHIHPFADGNGRTGRALALWELYRRGFDSHHIFAVDEYYWEDRPAYYAALDEVRTSGEDLSAWLEYCAAGLHRTLESAWMRVQQFESENSEKLILKPRQEHLLRLLRDHESMAPAQIWEALQISRQGAMDLLHPLLDAGIVERIGGKKTGRYRLCRR